MRPKASPLPASDNIRELVSEGDEILVQVLKDPLGTKGARLTTFTSIPSRYLVFMPKGHGIGVSARIEDEEERKRLRETVSQFVSADEPGGYIVRTAADGASPRCSAGGHAVPQATVGSDSRQGSANPSPVTSCTRIIRCRYASCATCSTRAWTASVSIHRRPSSAWANSARTFMPESAHKIVHYTNGRPIFDLHGIEDEILKALDRKVPLKSGGYLIMDQTEAMTTIDVNTGAYVGHRNLEETIFRTNLEASLAIARQLRLRNLGGIIIIDFIDMQEEEHRGQVLQALGKYLDADHAKTHISSVSPLGLVEMTRKRTRESLEHLLCQPCPTCEGHGFVKTAETVCYEIFREIVRQHRQFDFQQLMVLAHQDVVDLLLDGGVGGTR